MAIPVLSMRLAAGMCLALSSDWLRLALEVSSLAVDRTVVSVASGTYTSFSTYFVPSAG